MSEDTNNKKLGNYVAYGITFGIFAGSLISLIGFMFDITFIQIAGPAFGISLGTIAGALIYSIKNNKKS